MPTRARPYPNGAIAVILSSETRFPRSRLTTTALVIVAVTAALIGVVTFLEHRLEGLILHVFSVHTGGRAIRVNGDFDVRWLSLRPRITASRVVVDNPPWMPAGVTAEFGQVTLSMRWQLSTLPLRIQRLELKQTQLHLLRDARGRANWYASADGAGNGPPLIESLEVPDAHVDLRDDRWHLHFQGRLSAGDAAHGGARLPPLHIEAHGELNGRAASLSIEADPLLSARRDRAYHFSMLARSQVVRLSADGFLAQAFDLRVLQGNFVASGPDLKQLHFLVAFSWPDTGAFRFSGTLHRNDDRFKYDDLILSSADSELRGNLLVDSTLDRPAIEGALRAKRLRLAQLGPRADSPEPDAKPAVETRLADAPLRAAGLLGTDWNVALRVDELQFGAGSLHALSATFSEQQGVLNLHGFSATLAQGRITGSARLDAVSALARAELNVTAEQVQLDQLLRYPPQAPAPVSGLISGRVHLGGSGRTLRELAAAAEGTVAAVMPKGEVQGALVQSAGLELGGLFGRLRKSGKETDIRCAVTKLDVHEGIGTVRTLVIDTGDTLLSGEGTVNLASSDALDLSLRGHPKHPSLALHSSLHVQGSLTHPRLSVSGHDVAGQTAAAVALGVLLTPIASVLAFVNPGLAHDADCAVLTAQAAATLATNGGGH
jgi:AsmA family protein